MTNTRNVPTKAGATALVRRFVAERSGNIAVAVAATALVMMGTIGGAIDFATVSNVRVKLQNAADSAALTGAIGAKNSSSGGTASGDLTTAQTSAVTTFTDIVGTLAGVSVTKKSASVTYASGAITSTLDWGADVSTNFSRVIGLESFSIAGTATATAPAGLPTYVDVWFVIDNSHSMAIGATATDQATMLKKIGCTIACHMASGTDTVTSARNAGATLRLDVIKSAIAQILTKAKTVQAASVEAGYGSTIRVGFYTLSNTLTKQFAVSSDLSAASTALATIDIDYASGETGTNFHTALASLASAGLTAGDGKTSSTPKTYVILMTDGIEDSAIQKVTTTSTTKNGKTTTTTSSSLTRDSNFVDYSPYSRDTSHGFNWDVQGFDPSLCTTLKSSGLNLMTLNVEYLVPTLSPDASDDRYLYIKNTLKSKIQTNMASCASESDWALYASTSDDISTAVDTLFTLATQSSIYLSK
ncbi:MAG: hypothetical protein GX458_23305 [Phyllobacteriaceae bacterium]|nr:hypothetical protein [Phyllobacteriaceae bacterium]